MDESTLARQLARLREAKRRRDASSAGRALGRLHKACGGGENVLPPLIEAAKARATVGEMTAVMRGVFGTYVEPAVV